LIEYPRHFSVKSGSDLRIASAPTKLSSASLRLRTCSHAM
jgi:hypothetical protein